MRNIQLSAWGLAQAFSLIKFVEKCFFNPEVTYYDVAAPFLLVGILLAVLVLIDTITNNPKG